jgi:hypothetical protein
MEKDHPHLTLVDSSFLTDDDEFLPLPFYPWDERPPTLPIDADEAATSLKLAQGVLKQAAALLKVSEVRFRRVLKQSPRLQRIMDEQYGLAVDRAAGKYIEALDAPDARRQEWGASKILSSRAAIGHPFSPAPSTPSSTASLTLTDPVAARSITFRWRTDQDPDPNTLDDPPPAA